MRLNEKEEACLRLLAQMFEEDSAQKGYGSKTAPKLGVTQKELAGILKTMEAHGALKTLTNTSDDSFFSVSPHAVQLAREIDAVNDERRNAPPPDLVDRFQKWTRSRPWVAWPLIGGIILLAIIAAANQVIEFLQKIGVLEGQK